jgi:hypothetical protein
MRCALLLIALVGCGGKPGAKPIENVPDQAKRSAQDYERAVGGPRDYQLAFEAHLVECDGGRGDIASCDAALDALGNARGTARSIERVLELLGQMCKRGDEIGCGYELMLEAFTNPRPPGEEAPGLTPAQEAMFERIEKACEERREPRACWFEQSMSWGGGDGSAAEERRAMLNDIGCRAGYVEGCEGLLWELHCPTAECERARIAEWRASGYRDRELAAYTTLTTRCDAGDARACQELSGRALSDEELCAAKDYGACAHRACFGDEAAAELARVNQARSNCQVAGDRATAYWTNSKDDVPPPLLAVEPRDVSWFKPTKPIEYLVTWPHGGRDRLNWPRVDLHNFGPDPVVAARVCIYIYDAQLTQLARIHQTVTQRIPPNGKIALELAHPPGARPLGRNATKDAVFVDRVEVEGAPPVEDATICPEKKPYQW